MSLNPLDAPFDAAEFKAGLDKHAEGWQGDSPFFIAGGVNAWNWTPTDVADLGELLAADDRYQVVLADTFFDLIRATADPQPPVQPVAAGRRPKSTGAPNVAPSTAGARR